MKNMALNFVYNTIMLLMVANNTYAFSTSSSIKSIVSSPYTIPSHSIHSSTILTKMSSNENNNPANKKKRRRRKTQPTTLPEDNNDDNTILKDDMLAAQDMEQNTMSIEELRSIANFRSSSSSSTTTTTPVPPSSSQGLQDTSSNLVGDLPDIKDALKRKEMKRLEEVAAAEQQEERKRPKISRKDKAAFLQLLEEQPFADADDSYFEEEEYGTVSALLGEGTKPFLGIPPGPLQVGHFIGALGIILCAFVEYPGFPLTNLPTPVRDALQGGLGTIYTINIILAVLAALKAPERGQSSLLWGVKTFSVGGLAFDQLSQLPTLEQKRKAAEEEEAMRKRKKKGGNKK